jgi:hypothetical protein
MEKWVDLAACAFIKEVTVSCGDIPQITTFWCKKCNKEVNVEHGIPFCVDDGTEEGRQTCLVSSKRPEFIWSFFKTNDTNKLCFKCLRKSKSNNKSNRKKFKLAKMCYNGNYYWKKIFGWTKSQKRKREQIENMANMYDSQTNKLLFEPLKFGYPSFKMQPDLYSTLKEQEEEKRKKILPLEE